MSEGRIATSKLMKNYFDARFRSNHLFDFARCLMGSRTLSRCHRSPKARWCAPVYRFDCIANYAHASIAALPNSARRRDADCP
jgi:hypothetical protein